MPQSPRRTPPSFSRNLSEEGLDALPNAAKSGLAGFLGAPSDVLQAMINLQAARAHMPTKEVPGTSEKLAEYFGADLTTASGIAGLIGGPDPSDLGKLASLTLAARIKKGQKVVDDDYIQIYHGTHTGNLANIEKSGILASGDRGRGATFASPRPDTAFAYVERGGEQAILKANKRVPYVPDEERALLVVRVPRSWWEKHAVQEKIGGTTPEVGFDTTIPPEFIHDVIVGDRGAVYLQPHTELPGLAPLVRKVEE